MIQHPKKMLIEKIIQKDQNIKLSYNQDTNLKNEFIKPSHYSHRWLCRTYKPYLETLLCVNFLFDLIRHDYPWKSPLKTEQTFHCDKNFPPCRRKLPTWRSRASLKLPTWLFRCQAVFCVQHFLLAMLCGNTRMHFESTPFWVKRLH